MFRKITHIIFAILLLVATTGITFSMHYCGGRLISTSINYEAKPCCNDTGCCNNKTIHYEVKNDFVSPAEISHIVPVEFDVELLQLFVNDVVLFSVEEKECYSFYDSSPPNTIQTRLSLLQTYLC